VRALDGVAARRGSAAGFLLSGWTLAALAAAAALLPPFVTLVGFAFVSAAAMREFRAPRWLFLLLPLQFTNYR
jgi:chromate transport protein ChrA